MTHHSYAVERIGTRAPGNGLAFSVRMDEAAPRLRNSARRLVPGAPRLSVKARNAHMDSQGRQHFNFPQRVWLSPSAPIVVTPGKSIALETLAINLLTPLTRQRD